MRIVHIDRQRSWTGQTVRTYAIAAGMRERGHEVAFIASPDSELAKRGRAAGIDVLEVPMRGWRGYRSVLKIRSFLKARPVDVLHCHGPRDHQYAVLAANKRTVRHLVRTKHNHSHMRSGFLSRMLFNPVARVITVSEWVRQALIEDGLAPERVSTLHDAIDIDRFTPRPRDPEVLRAHGLEGVETIVGSLSSLHPRKGVEATLRAYRLVRDALPDASMRCVLVGKRFEQWQPLVAELGLEDEVVFPGYQVDQPAYLALLDVYVLPSLKEALGTSIVEAMCMERPVVVSGVGGIPEAVTEGTGVVVDDPTPENLAAEIIALVRDPERRSSLGKAARARALEHFSMQRLLDETEALYTSLMAE